MFSSPESEYLFIICISALHTIWKPCSLAWAGGTYLKREVKVAKIKQSARRGWCFSSKVEEKLGCKLNLDLIHLQGQTFLALLFTTHLHNYKLQKSRPIVSDSNFQSTYTQDRSGDVTNLAVKANWLGIQNPGFLVSCWADIKGIWSRITMRILSFHAHGIWNKILFCPPTPLTPESQVTQI